MKLLHHVSVAVTVVGLLIGGSTGSDSLSGSSQASNSNPVNVIPSNHVHNDIPDNSRNPVDVNEDTLNPSNIGQPSHSNNIEIETDVNGAESEVSSDSRDELNGHGEEMQNQDIREMDVRKAQLDEALRFCQHNDVATEFLKEYIRKAPLSDSFDRFVYPDAAAFLYSRLFSLPFHISIIRDYGIIFRNIIDNIYDPRAAYLGRALSSVIQQCNSNQLQDILDDENIPCEWKMLAVNTPEQLLNLILINDRNYPVPFFVVINTNEDGSLKHKEIYDKVIAYPQVFASEAVRFRDGASIDSDAILRKLLDQACKNIIEDELNFLKKYPNSEYYKFPMFADPKIGRFVGVIYARARLEGILPPGRLDPRLMVLSHRFNNRDAIEKYWDEIYADEMEKLKNFFKDGPSFGMDVLRNDYKPTIVDINYFEFKDPSEIEFSTGHKLNYYTPKDVRFSGDVSISNPLNLDTYLNVYLPALRKTAINLFADLLDEFRHSFGFVYDLQYVSLLSDPKLLEAAMQNQDIIANDSELNNDTITTIWRRRAAVRYRREKNFREDQLKRLLRDCRTDAVATEFLKEYIRTAPLSNYFDRVISPFSAAVQYSKLYNKPDEMLFWFNYSKELLQKIINNIDDPRAAYLGRAFSSVIQRGDNNQLQAILNEDNFTSALKMFAVNTPEQLLNLLLLRKRNYPIPFFVAINTNEDGSFIHQEIYDKVIAFPEIFASANFRVHDGPGRKLFRQACKNIIEDEFNFLKKYPNSEYYKFPMFADPKIGRFVGVIYARARLEGILPSGRLDPRLMVLSTQLNDRDAIEDYWDEIYADEMDKLENFFKKGPTFGLDIFSRSDYKPTITDMKYFECKDPSAIEFSPSHKTSHYTPKDVRFSCDDETSVPNPLNLDTYLNVYLPALRKTAINLFADLLDEFRHSFSYVYDLQYVSLLPDPKLLETFFCSNVTESEVFIDSRDEFDIREAQLNQALDLPLFRNNDAATEFLKEYIRTAPLSNYFDRVISPFSAAVQYSKLYNKPDEMLTLFNHSKELLQNIINNIDDPRAAYLGRALSSVIQRCDNNQLEAILNDQNIPNALKMFAVNTPEQLLNLLLQPNIDNSPQDPVIFQLNEDGSFKHKEIYDKVIAIPQVFASLKFRIDDGASIDAGGPRRRLFDQACNNIIGDELNFLKKYPNSEYYKFPMFADPNIGRFVGVIYSRARLHGIFPPGRLDPRLMVLSSQLNNRDAIAEYWDEIYADEMEKLKNFFEDGRSFGLDIFSHSDYKPTIKDMKYFEFKDPSAIEFSPSHKTSHYTPQDVRFSGDDETSIPNPLNLDTYLNLYLPVLRETAIDLFANLLNEFKQSFGFFFELRYVSLLSDPKLLETFFGSHVAFNAENVFNTILFDDFNFDSDSFLQGRRVPASENIEAIIMSMTTSQLHRFVLAVTAVENVDPSIMRIYVRRVEPLYVWPRATARSNIFPELDTITSAGARKSIADICNALKETNPSLVIPYVDDFEFSNDVSHQEYKAALSNNLGNLMNEDEIDRKVQDAFSPFFITEEELNALAQRVFEYQKNKYHVPDAVKSNALPDDIFLFSVATCFNSMSLEENQDAYGMLYAIAHMLNESVNYMRG